MSTATHDDDVIELSSTRIDMFNEEIARLKLELEAERDTVADLRKQIAEMQAQDIWEVSDLRGPIVQAIEKACREHDGVVEWPKQVTVKVDTLPDLCDLECVSPVYGTPGVLSVEIVSLEVRVRK